MRLLTEIRSREEGREGDAGSLESVRGTFQTIGLVTDVEPFLRQLAEALAGRKPDA